jgi:carboxymethylenebutenolidase
VKTDVLRYPGAGHGSTATRDGYHDESAKDGWARALGWFSSNLVA